MKWPTKEAEVAVLCSRVKMSSEQMEQVADLTSNSDFNWMDFLDHTMQHRLSGLIAQNIRELSTLPVGIRKVLTILTAFNREKGRLFVVETEELFRVFNSLNIKVVLFKGPRLFIDVYPEYSFRTFNDLDILILPQDYPKVKKVLNSFGYDQGEVVNGELVKMNDTVLAHIENNLQHYGTFIKKGESAVLPWISIDVHTRFTTAYDSFSYDIDRVIDEAVTTQINSTDVFVLNPTDHIIHLCLHLYWHTRSIMNISINDDLQLYRFVDIYESINQLNIDWDKLIKIVKEEKGLQQAVTYTLFLTEKIYGNIIPTRVREELWTDDIDRHLDSISERWINESDSVIGYWDTPFEERMFNKDRVNEAYRIFYEYVRNEKRREIRKL